MVGITHERITAAALTFLPEEEQNFWAPFHEELRLSSNYPDNFYGLMEPNERAAAEDPDWMDFMVIPSPGGNFNGHCPKVPDAEWYRMEYWLSQAVKCLKAGQTARGAKFAGCISHVVGDSGQPAHIMAENVVSDLFMQYGICAISHSLLEHIIGEIPPADYSATMLGHDIRSTAWIALERIARLSKSERMEIPVLFQGIREKNTAMQAESAGRTGLHCAMLEADILHSIYQLAFHGEQKSEPYDLCISVPSAIHCDSYMNYDIMIDRVPDNADCFHPLPLDPGDGRKHHGIAMLPDLCPYLHIQRSAWAEYKLPRGMFKRFSALCGLCRKAKNEAPVSFEIWLDDRRVFTSAPVTEEDAPVAIQVEIGSEEKLRLRVIDVRDDQYNTAFYYPVWCEPQLFFK